MGNGTLSKNFCRALTFWQGTRLLKPVGIILSVMSTADVMVSLYKFYRIWQGG